MLLPFSRLLPRILRGLAYENSRTWRQIFYDGDRNDNTLGERGPTEKDVLQRGSGCIAYQLNNERAFCLLAPAL